MNVLIKKNFIGPGLVINPYRYLIILLSKLAPKTFLLRIVLVVTLSFSVLIAVIIIGFYDQQWRQIRTTLNDYLAKDILLAVKTASKYNNKADMQEALRGISTQIFVTPVVEENVKYKQVDSSGLTKETAKFYDELVDILGKNLVFIDESSKKNSLVNLLVSIDNKYWLQFNLKRELFYLSSFNYIVYVLIALCSIIVLIMLQFFRLQIRPLKQLAIASRKLGNGEPVGYLKSYGAKEIVEATNAFNIMKEQLQAFLKQRTLMLGAISHDLFTVLTRINLLVELQTKEDYSEIKEEVLIMQQMIQSYLDFANSTTQKKDVSLININNFITDIVNRYQNQIKIVFNNTIGADAKISASPQQLLRVFDSLLNNCIRYSNQVKITISNNNSNSAVRIDIEDNGIDIPKDKYADIFLPFYKINQARTPEKSSVGLGLYIVKDIVLNHGGSIDIDSSDMGGVKISIVFVSK